MSEKKWQIAEENGVPVFFIDGNWDASISHHSVLARLNAAEEEREALRKIVRLFLDREPHIRLFDAIDDASKLVEKQP